MKRKRPLTPWQRADEEQFQRELDGFMYLDTIAPMPLAVRLTAAQDGLEAYRAELLVIDDDSRLVVEGIRFHFFGYDQSFVVLKYIGDCRFVVTSYGYRVPGSCKWGVAFPRAELPDDWGGPMAELVYWRCLSVAPCPDHVFLPILEDSDVYV